MFRRIISTIIGLAICFNNVLAIGSIGSTQSADTRPISFYSADFEHLLRQALGKAEGGSIYAHELEPITCINISDDLMTFEGRIHNRLNTPQTITTISLRDTLLFPNLDTLYVCDIAVSDVNTLPALPSLTKLTLIGCSLENCDIFADMHKLTYLSIVRNNIKTLEPLSTMTQLESLSIATNLISTLEPLKTLVNLKYLNCDCNAANDLNVVTYMPKLKMLLIGGAGITSLEPLKELTALESLQVFWTDSDMLSLAPLQSLENLETVSLFDTRVDDLSYLAHVKYVSGGEEIAPPAHVIDFFGVEDNEDGSIIITDYVGDAAPIQIPAELDGKPVTRIGKCAFSENEQLQSVTIPDGVLAIENEAFMGCKNLESVTLPEGLLSIGNYAFLYCHSLRSIAIPAGVTQIGGHAFRACGLTEVELPDNLSSISGRSFDARVKLTLSESHPKYRMEGDMLIDKTTNELVFYSIDDSVTEIRIPEGITRIGNSVFWGCNKLTSIAIPSSVTAIGGDAFMGCASLISIDIPTNVDTIDYYAFGSCTSLKHITLSEGLKSIGDFAFFYCDALEEITLPDTVVSLGHFAFMGCKNLYNVTLSNSLEAIRSMLFMECENLKRISIPSSVISIDVTAFWGCNTHLSDVRIAQSEASGPENAELCFVVETGSYAEEWVKNMGYGNVEVH